jgi:hypothetical protein
VTVPGEGFSESSVGREESSVDWGDPWGVFTYPAMAGYRVALAPGDFLVDIGLANNEIGYIVPETDIHPYGHPDWYEEQYCISQPAEGIIREAIAGMLAD